MSASYKKKRRIPLQRGTAPDAVPPLEALCPEAQRQWDLMQKLAPSVRKTVFALTRSTDTVDEIESRVWLAILIRLTNSGPLDGKFGTVKSYLWQVVREKSATYLQELAKRAEDFVGDDMYLLERQEPHPSAESEAALVDLAPAMRVLAEEMSDLQLRAWVLAEAYDLKSPVIADLLGGTTTKESVRDALRNARAKLRSERVGLRLGVLAED
ncbi:hypothetical protein SUDANB105_08146 (plasmid) [Streptomyces sp. enrichment culture]|uniref:hypothetical protein n=1 Tax=Streptomyces sp. enrichment culture TaxID=1795815 RepID=UPI003F572188